MNKNKIMSEAKIITSSPNLVNLNVGGNTVINKLIRWCILNAFNIESQGTKYVVVDYEKIQSQLDYFIEKEKEQIMRAYNQGYRDSENAEESTKSLLDVSQWADAQLYYDITCSLKKCPKVVANTTICEPK